MGCSPTGDICTKFHQKHTFVNYLNSPAWMIEMKVFVITTAAACRTKFHQKHTFVNYLNSPAWMIEMKVFDIIPLGLFFYPEKKL
jgi:hypothetical protein